MCRTLDANRLFGLYHRRDAKEVIAAVVIWLALPQAQAPGQVTVPQLDEDRNWPDGFRVHFSPFPFRTTKDGQVLVLSLVNNTGDTVQVGPLTFHIQETSHELADRTRLDLLIRPKRPVHNPIPIPRFVIGDGETHELTLPLRYPRIIAADHMVRVNISVYDIFYDPPTSHTDLIAVFRRKVPSFGIYLDCAYRSSDGVLVKVERKRRRIVEDTLRLPGAVQLQIIRLEPGGFEMGFGEARLKILAPEGGWSRGKNCDGPAHRTKIENPFWIGKYEVTQRQWEAVMKANPSRFRNTPDLPVERVTHEEARDFCAQLGRLIKRSVRLPSETEWEYACQAGSSASLLNAGAWSPFTSSGKTHPVGGLLPNDWDIHDMFGNVGEWCDSVDEYPGTLCKIKKGATVWRGGSWRDPLDFGCGRTRFFAEGSRYSSDSVGLRIVVDEPPRNP